MNIDDHQIYLSFPSTAGLIGVMPAIGAIVLVCMYLDHKGDTVVMQEFTKGALWGMLPTILFFVVAFICFKRQCSLPVVLTASFGMWLGAAMVHQWIIK
jgi:F0F1-type ATP synthase assembly protein I